MKQKPNASFDWYELWEKQSEIFFDSADENLKHLFSQQKTFNPKEHAQLINIWLEHLKQHWSIDHLEIKQPEYVKYLQMIADICNAACELMVKEWIKRFDEKNPIKNIRELYELWLDCCKQVYEQTAKTKVYQETYGKMLNSAFKYWQTILPKRDK